MKIKRTLHITKLSEHNINISEEIYIYDNDGLYSGYMYNNTYCDEIENNDIGFRALCNGTYIRYYFLNDYESISNEIHLNGKVGE